MATHVGLHDVFQVCRQTRPNWLKTLLKQCEMTLNCTIPDGPTVRPKRSLFIGRVLCCPIEVAGRSPLSWRSCQPALVNSVRYHKHSCSQHDGNENNCCRSGQTKDHQQSVMADQECWKCGRSVDDQKERYFCTCGVVQPPVARRSLFDVMGVKETFDVDLHELTEKYRGLQRLLHPDKYSQKSETEKEFSLQHSALVNRAYNTLQRPLARGLYLLHLNEDSLEHETHLSTAEFLDEIMTINEDLIEAETAEEMNAVGDRNQAKIDDLVNRISEAFKNDDANKAKELLLRLKYYSNIQEKVKEALQRVV